MTTRTVILFLLLISVFSLWGQQQLDIRTDKSFYTTGEQIGMSVANTSGDSPEIIYIELLSTEGVLLDRITTKSNGLVATAVFSIPLDWSSNWYFVRAYSIWMPSLAVKDIGYSILAIYNEFDRGNITENQYSDTILIPNTPVQQIRIQTDKERYQNGETVNVGISTGTGNETRQKGALVITVVDRATYELEAFFREVIPVITIPNFAVPPGESRPLHQLLYLGRIKESLGDLIGALYIVQLQTVSWVPFNEQRVFALQLEDFTGQLNAQFVGLEPLGGVKYLEPEVFYPSAGWSLPRVTMPPLPYTRRIASYLEDCRKRRIIEDLFGPSGNTPESTRKEPVEFLKPDRRYLTKDYVQFTDMEEFIREAATFIKLRQSTSGISFRVLMERNKVAEEEPLLFLNGFMVTDLEELLNLEVNQVERIDLYRTEKSILPQFNILGRNGVVAFYTKDQSWRPQSGSQLKLNGFQAGPSIIRAPVSSASPSFSPRLYWDAGLTIGADGKAGVSFQASNDLGEYLIIVDQITERENKRAIHSIYLTPKS